MDYIKEEADKFGTLSYIEKQTKGQVKKEHILVVLIGVLGIMTFTRLAPLVIGFAGVVIPFKESLMVLGSVTPKISETKHLLVFWMLYGLLVSFELVFGWLIKIIPMYYLLKLGFLWYIGPLRFRGAYHVYEMTFAKIPASCYMGEYDPVENAKKIASQVEKTAENYIKKEISEGNKDN